MCLLTEEKRFFRCTNTKEYFLITPIRATLMALKHGVKYVEYAPSNTKLNVVCWKVFEAEPVVYKVVHVKQGITSILKTENW